MSKYLGRLLAVGVIVGASLAGSGSCAEAGESDSARPRPIPLTRPEMKQALEDLKAIEPWIPLPELTAEEQAAAAENPRGLGYESRLRRLYSPGGESRSSGSFGGSRPAAPGEQRRRSDDDPAMTLDYRFKTMLFWITSRANNCHY
jgi:hypothetical protein